MKRSKWVEHDQRMQDDKEIEESVSDTVVEPVSVTIETTSWDQDILFDISIDI